MKKYIYTLIICFTSIGFSTFAQTYATPELKAQAEKEQADKLEWSKKNPEQYRKQGGDLDANNKVIIKEKENEIYNKSIVDIESSSCNQAVNKIEILDKEFSDTKFSLNLKKKQLIMDRKNLGNSKIIEFSINNSKMIFKDQEEYGKLEAYFSLENDLPVIKFKDHSDDCFFFVIKFDK